MDKINIEHRPDEESLKKQGVFTWPIWTKEKSEFPWTYNEKETCYLLEGDVVVTPLPPFKHIAEFIKVFKLIGKWRIFIFILL